MNIFKDYTPKSKYLVCMDSDGCVMDTMDVKHISCFAPEWISVFGLEEQYDEAMKIWLDINLYTMTRGINRFSGLAMACGEMIRKGARIEDSQALIEWTVHAMQLSNPALEQYLTQHPSPCLVKALEWSKRVNASIAALPDNSKPYPAVRESMRSIYAQADIVGVSSANGAAVRGEWQKHDLKQYTRLLCCQETGTKAEIIRILLGYGYEPQNVLMVGDAFGDKAAAEKNGIWFYPILTGYEQESWERLVREAIPALTEGTFSRALQQTYLFELDRVLQIQPV